MDAEQKIDALARHVVLLQRRVARLEAGAQAAGLPPLEVSDAPEELKESGLTVASAPVQPPPAPSIPALPAQHETSWETRPVPPPVAQPAWGSPAPSQAAKPAPVARTPISLKDLEERFAGRALAWIGAIALIAAAVFFLSLAFSRGWITEPMRVAIGLVVGAAAFAGGAAFLARRNPLLGNALAGVGLGIVSISLFAATQLYGLLSPEVGLAAALLAACAAAFVAIRFDAQSVAVFGLISALIAPPLVGASPTLLTLLFVAVTLVGTTAIALFKTWPWLPSLAFLLAAPQLASWLFGDPEPAQAIVALVGFWAVNIVAAAGEEIRIRRDDLRPSSAILVLANATFLLMGFTVVLSGSLDPWLGLAVALASIAHLLIGGWFLWRQGLEHLFGNLVAGTGVALLTIAAFVQLGAPAVPVAWAAEAVALAWLAVRRLHRWSALAALALGGLAIAHLVIVEFPLTDAGIPAAITFDPPLVNPETASLGAVLAALAMAAVLVPVRWIRSALAGIGVLLVAYAATFLATGAALTAALVVVGLAGLALDRMVLRFPDSERLARLAGAVEFPWIASLAAVVSAAMTIVLLFSTEFPPSALGTLTEPPFLNPACLSLVIALAGLVAAGVAVPVCWVRSAMGAVGILLVAWALAFQVTGATLVALLVVLLPAAVVLDRGLQHLPDEARFASLARWSPTQLLATAAGAMAWTAAALYALATLLTPADWGKVQPPFPPFSDERALVGALLVGAVLAAALWLVPMRLRRIAVLAAIVTTAWVIPFEVHADLVVVLWVALAGAALLATRWDPAGALAYVVTACVLWAGGAAVAFGIVAPPDRLWVVDYYRLPLLTLWPLAFAALALAAYLAPRFPVFARWRMILEATAGVIAFYAVSIGVVAIFQTQAGGTIPTEELAKQAQVALSVCWTAIGLVLLLLGLTTHRPMLRHAGFAVLALAIVKVFVIDLASMDVAYRALVLAGLGLLLLASAFVVTRFRGPRPGPTGLAGGRA